MLHRWHRGVTQRNIYKKTDTSLKLVKKSSWMLGLAITSDSIDFRLRFLVQSLIFPFLFSATFHSPFAETKAGTREDGLEAKKKPFPSRGVCTTISNYSFKGHEKDKEWPQISRCSSQKKKLFGLETWQKNWLDLQKKLLHQIMYTFLPRQL